MVTKIVIAVAVLIIGVLLLAATKPDSFRVQRSIGIKAAPAKIFASLDDFHRWGTWSPWEKLDPALQRTFSGAASGKGSIYEWEGNSKVGKGRMEIVEAAPPSSVRIKLDFLRPFEAHNTAEFTLTGAGDSTSVNWAMYGPSTYMTKVMSVFMSMDQMIGKDFERGLANLKAISES